MFRDVPCSGFISPQNENLHGTLKSVESFSYILYFCFVKVGFEKRETNTRLSLMTGSSLILPRIQHKVVLLVWRTAVGV